MIITTWGECVCRISRKGGSGHGESGKGRGKGRKEGYNKSKEDLD